MLLTQEIIERLKACCEAGEKIVIEGFNGFGDTFTTKGRVSRDDSTSPVVYENVVFLDFGHREGRPYSEYVASFVTECDDFIAGDDLIVSRILFENGEVLFKNTDAEKYMAKAQSNMAKREAETRKEGRWIEEHDPVSKAMMSMVGRPFRMGKHKGVVSVPPRVATFSGHPIVDYKTVGKTGLFIDSDSCLEVMNLETGEFDQFVFNGLTRPEGQKLLQSEIDKAFETKMRTEKLIWERKEKIEEIKSNKPSQPGEEE